MSTALNDDRELVKAWRALAPSGTSLETFAKHWFELPEADRISMTAKIRKSR